MRKVEKGQKEFTASVWILTKSKPKKVLLVHHKKYDKWIQPGGHIEKFENPFEAAIREVKEETGLNIDFINKYMESTHDGVINFLQLPDFFLEQKIPTYKDQREHYHLDYQYIIEINEQVLKYNDLGSHGIGWFTQEDVLVLPMHEDTKQILKKLL